MAVAQARERRWVPVLGLVGSHFDNGTGKHVGIINVNLWPIGLDLHGPIALLQVPPRSV